MDITYIHSTVYNANLFSSSMFSFLASGRHIWVPGLRETQMMARVLASNKKKNFAWIVLRDFSVVVLSTVMGMFHVVDTGRSFL